MLQVLAAYTALRFLGLIGRHVAWCLLGGALSVMALRRGLVLLRTLEDWPYYKPDLSGEWLALITSALALCGVYGIKGIFFNLKRSREETFKAWEQYRSLVESTDDSVYLVDKDCQFLYVNQRYLSRLGLPLEEVYGKRYEDFHPPEASKEFCQKVKEVFESGSSVQYEHRSLRDGRYFLRTLSPVKDTKGEVVAVTVISKDITELKKTQMQLAYLATHDPLTGLPNRNLFMDRLKMALEHAKRHGRYFALLFLDLDNFKDVNDTLGHTVGDEVLKAVAERLRRSVRKTDTVARMGGDEFLILLSEISKPEDAATVASHLFEALKEPFYYQGEKFELSISIGIAVYPLHGTDPETLFKNADKAMYEAKAKGKGACVSFGDLIRGLKEEGREGRQGEVQAVGETVHGPGFSPHPTEVPEV